MILTWCIRSTVPREWVALLISYVVDGYMFTLHYPSPLIMFISSVDIYQVYHFIILPEYFILNLTHWIKFLFLNKIVPLTDCKPSRCLTDPIQQYADCTVWSLIVINITMIIMNKKRYNLLKNMICIQRDCMYSILKAIFYFDALHYV